MLKERFGGNYIFKTGVFVVKECMFKVSLLQPPGDRQLDLVRMERVHNINQNYERFQHPQSYDNSFNYI